MYHLGLKGTRVPLNNAEAMFLCSLTRSMEVVDVFCP